MASVKVAVRVRPFNNREVDLESKLIIQMDGKKTRIFNSKNGVSKETKDFTFDHSYWSYDPEDRHFASQEEVFQDLGTDVVDSAFHGYNACVFAYGQTGSGKTFTMMGTPENQGLIPRICKSMFERMHVGKESGASYRTEVSYLEIYNEKVKDLLQSNSSHSLRVREHPSMGPYVQELSRHLVTDYADIQEWMKRGNVHRTTARTNMNDTSSRSHAIFTITFVQAEFSRYHPTETVSKIHLVDLAGSERADATGATGERLKEGAHINKSLVTLGLVISSLAKLSGNPSDPSVKRSSAFIPYRDSVLTWLLKDSLGGNSKTIMIAAISPADVNYEETLSTLRYANRAKNIINKPTVNEDPNVTLIRTLREEIDKLKLLLGDDRPSDKVETQMLAQLQQKEAREKELTEEWTEKWRETKQILEEQSALGLRKSGVGIILDSDRPHLIGIDDDLLSTGVTFYHLKDGETLIGTEDSSTKQDIKLSGGGIEPEHCSIVLADSQAWLHPRPNAQCWVNTIPVDKPVRLSQGCIILLGRNMFRFNDPAEAAVLRKTGSRSHLNLSNLSLVYSSTTDLAERTFSSENLLDESKFLLEEREDDDVLLQSSPKERADRINEQLVLENGQQEREKLEEAQKVLEKERQEMEAGFQAERERLAANWERLEKKDMELQLKNQELNSSYQLHESNVEVLTKDVMNLEKKKTEKRKELDTVQAQLATLGISALADTSALSQTLSQEHAALLALTLKHKEDLSSLDEELDKKRLALNTALTTAMDTDSVQRRLSARSASEVEEIRQRKESMNLPLNQNQAEDRAQSDSGLGSSQTERSASLKRRSRGSDSSEEDLAPGRQRGRVLRSKQLSKSCRAIYDEVGVGEAMRAMKQLCQKVAAQKLLIMQSLENDCGKDEINVQIAELQDLHRQYVRLEAILELRRENVLLRMQESRAVNSPASISDLSSPHPMPLARSMPSLRAQAEQFTSWLRVPNFVLRGVGRQSRYEFELRFFTDGEFWVLMRRYRRFRELHLAMVAKYGPQVQALDFPPRQFLVWSAESVARRRRAQLETYLLQLITVCSRIRGSPLYGCGDSPSRQQLVQFSPFFRKGLFEPGKFGTS